jgi:hypothetical protein
MACHGHSRNDPQRLRIPVELSVPFDGPAFGLTSRIPLALLAYTKVISICGMDVLSGGMQVPCHIDKDPAKNTMQMS